MTASLRLLGALALLLTGGAVSAILTKEKAREREELREWIRFFERLYEEIGCRLSPPEELFCTLRLPRLEEAGFLPALREGRFFSEAYGACEGRLAAGERTKEILSDFASGFGGGFREEELARAKQVVAALTAIYEGERVAFSREIRLRRVLPVSAAVALTLLLL